MGQWKTQAPVSDVGDVWSCWCYNSTNTTSSDFRLSIAMSALCYCSGCVRIPTSRYFTEVDVSTRHFISSSGPHVTWLHISQAVTNRLSGVASIQHCWWTLLSLCIKCSVIV